ncbi:DUF1272 domain-containing protein [Metabacillus litoralis]|uniref:DUF1272 domain-containing protein n=2 Tax=Metabacillus litoralis TaxID=152268 RepID=A0A5C6W5H2_9BACI|nr:DUF1272 domain-containing protein [Metabacillus litoralis]TXC91094.1 DUF1272 domain-containing protein [Metabacillus litoralis]
MGLEMKNICEKFHDSIRDDAYICVHECTFCHDCTKKMIFICPNCKGELVKRPKHLNKIR